MPNLHATSTFNVEATMNTWIKTQINTITVSLLTSPYTFIFTYPDIPITPPCFSVTHRQINRRSEYEGRVLSASESGVTAANLMDISAWVKRESNWQARMRQMQAMIEDVFAGTATVRVVDYTTPGTPATANYKINLGNLEAISMDVDTENPGIMRSRAQIRYEWTLRTTVS